MGVYKQNTALIFGILELMIGVMLIAFQINLFSAEWVIASASTGIWSGIYYVICGIVSIVSHKKPEKGIIRAVVTLSFFGILISIACIFTAVPLWIVGTMTAGGQGEANHVRRKISKDMHIAMISLAAIGLFIYFVQFVTSCISICKKDYIPVVQRSASAN